MQPTILLKTGENINQLDVNQRTPLHTAMGGGTGVKTEVMMALVKNGADLTLEDLFRLGGDEDTPRRAA